MVDLNKLANDLMKGLEETRQKLQVEILKLDPKERAKAQQEMNKANEALKSVKDACINL